jgi:thiamine biosynthesis protein ThiI
VASYLAMKRGTQLHFLTFHSYPYTPDETLDKVDRLVTILNRYQAAGTLYACNLGAAQKIIRDSCLDKYRTILYRRLMMRIATRLAQSLNCQALVTGEAVGQVASQTLKNMDVIARATDYLILRPLVSMDKHETMTIARKLGTLAISEEFSPDCCTVFEPSSPATGALLSCILGEEDKLDMPALIEISLTTLSPEVGRTS